MPGAPGVAGVRDEVERVGGARVLGLPRVVEVDHARVVVDDHVLQHGAEARAGLVDLGLGVTRELDRLGVATTFEVEDAVVGPAVFVVADERALGVGGEGRLAGAGEPEEERDVSPRSDVGGAVHG